jgi:hypothetical protein
MLLNAHPRIFLHQWRSKHVGAQKSVHMVHPSSRRACGEHSVWKNLILLHVLRTVLFICVGRGGIVFAISPSKENFIDKYRTILQRAVFNSSDPRAMVKVCNGSSDPTYQTTIMVGARYDLHFRASWVWMSVDFISCMFSSLRPRRPCGLGSAPSHQISSAMSPLSYAITQ